MKPVLKTAGRNDEKNQCASKALLPNKCQIKARRNKKAVYKVTSLQDNQSKTSRSPSRSNFDTFSESSVHYYENVYLKLKRPVFSRAMLECPYQLTSGKSCYSAVLSTRLFTPRGNTSAQRCPRTFLLGR